MSQYLPRMVGAKGLIGGRPFGIHTPEMYGAAGDNTTDDSAAIQAAMDAAGATGGEVYLPRVYAVANTLVSPGGISMRGPTRLVQSGSNGLGGGLRQLDATKPVLHLQAAATQVSRLSFLGVETAAPYNTHGGTLITLANPCKAVIDMCRFLNTTYAIATLNGLRVDIKNSTIWHTNVGLNLPVGDGGSIADSLIEGNDFWCRGYGILAGIGKLVSCVVQSNIFYLSGAGIQATNAERARIVNNRFIDNDRYGLGLLGATKRCIAVGNIFNNNGLDATAPTHERVDCLIGPTSAANPATDNVVVGNSFDTAEGRGLLINNFNSPLSNSKVIGNTGRVSVRFPDYATNEHHPIRHGTELQGFDVRESPNGSKWLVTVDDTGSVATTALA